MTEGAQVSWMAIVHGTKVVDVDNNDIGRVDAVLGDDDDDIFHGIALNLKGPAGIVEVPAARVGRITEEAVHTDLAADEARSLPKFEEDHWFEFEGITRFFKKSRWRKEE